VPRADQGPIARVVRTNRSSYWLARRAIMLEHADDGLHKVTPFGANTGDAKHEATRSKI